MTYYDWEHDLKPAMLGLWADFIMSAVSVDSKIFNGKHQPCPSCGGKDRFRFDNNQQEKGDGGYICSQCGAGDGAKLALTVTGWDFPTLVDAVGRYLGAQPIERVQAVKSASFAAIKDNSLGSYTDHQRCVEFMARCVDYPLAAFTAHHNITPPQVKVRERTRVNGEGVREMVDCRMAIPIHRISADLTIGEMCNVALLDSKGAITYLAGGVSYGCAAVIGEDRAKAVYLAYDIVDAWITHSTTNARILCAMDSLNLDEVAHLLQPAAGSGRLRMACNRDFDELCAAEKAGCKVILPVGETIYESRAFEMKIYDPAALLDWMEKPSGE